MSPTEILMAISSYLSEATFWAGGVTAWLFKGTPTATNLTEWQIRPLMGLRTAGRPLSEKRYLVITLTPLGNKSPPKLDTRDPIPSTLHTKSLPELDKGRTSLHKTVPIITTKVAI
jgi:hypothetical protein